MKKLIVMVSLLALAVSVNAATKAELRTMMDNSGLFVTVGIPIKLKPERGNGGMTAVRYYISVLFPKSDSLAVGQRAYYLWVLNDDLPEEQAFFSNNDPTATPVTAFDDIVLARMITLGVEGRVVETGSINNKEWAIVIRYQDGTTASDYKETKYKITRTDGTTWSIQKLEP